jgi:hypothetical protein
LTLGWKSKTGEIDMEPLLYWKREKEVSPWIPIPATREAVIQAVKDGAMFTTWTIFEHEPGNNGAGEPVRHGDLVLDFDCKENPAAALQDMRALCLQHLPEQFGIDPNAIRFFVSGGKGFHAVLPEWLLGHPEGHVKLPAIYKWMVQHVTRTFPLATLDMSLYCMGKGKMFRLPNVRRSNGNFKVPISLQEVMELDAAALEALSKAPRRIDRVDVETAPNADLAALYAQAVEELADLESAKSEPLTKVQIDQLAGEPPPCIRYILKNQPAKSEAFNFNRAVMLLVNFYQDTGVDQDAALEACREFLVGFHGSESYNTPALRVEHFQKQWAYMLEQIGYFFSCGRANGLKLPSAAYDCLRCIEMPAAVITEPDAADAPGGPAAVIIEPEAPGGPADNQYGFPFDVMLGQAGFCADAYGAVLEVPHHTLFMTFLTCLGAYFAPWVRMDSELDTSPRLFTIVVGESATDRKSTGLKKISGVFRTAFPGFRITEGMNSAEGLQRVLNDKEFHPFHTPGVVLMMFDEFRSFVSKCSIESSVLLPVVSTLFEGTTAEANTKEKYIRVDGAYLSMLAATTRETYEKIYTPAFLRIGFVNRVFIVPGHAKRRFSIPMAVDKASRKFIHDDLVRLRSFVGEGLVYNMTPAARKIYDGWYFDLDESVHAKRLETYSMRLMQLLALNQELKTIDEEVVSHAIALCDWQLKVRKLFDPIDADSPIARLEQSIRRQLDKEPLTEKKLKDRVNAHRTGLWMYDQAMENLKKHGEVVFDMKKKLWARPA